MSKSLCREESNAKQKINKCCFNCQLIKRSNKHGDQVILPQTRQLPGHLTVTVRINKVPWLNHVSWSHSAVASKAPRRSPVIAVPIVRIVRKQGGKGGAICGKLITGTVPAGCWAKGPNLSLPVLCFQAVVCVQAYPEALPRPSSASRSRKEISALWTQRLAE